jgi:hypothetical protein
MLDKIKIWTMPLFIAMLAASFAASAALEQSDQEKTNPGTEPPPGQSISAVPSPPAGPHRSPMISAQKSKSAEVFYKSVWGVDKLEVREASSGVLLRFSYRVTDANKAAVLNDKKLTPYLIDQKTGAVLIVPTLENVGLLRQTASPENGREYWMVFSNKGNFVKPLSRVNIVIGTFRANGLIVQ